MSPSLFILSICSYLVAMVAGLIAAFFVKQIPIRFIQGLIIIHFVIFIAWLLVDIEQDSISNPGYTNFLFLAFFCSGVFTAGMLLRSKFPVYLKLYYSIYLLSLAVFVISPSRVLGFIASGSIYSVSPSRFHLSENYYLVEQQSEPDSNIDSAAFKLYKVVREMGMFHKTLSRDVKLPVTTDSVKLLNKDFSDAMLFRAFLKKENHVDSLDLKIAIGNHRDDSRDIKQIRQ